jgi:hypothetical protein
MTFKICNKKVYVSINDYFIKLIYFCGFESLAKNSKNFAIFFLRIYTKNQRLQKKSIYFVTTMRKFAKKECWLVSNNSYCAPYDIPQFHTNMKIKIGTLMMKWSKYFFMFDNLFESSPNTISFCDIEMFGIIFFKFIFFWNHDHDTNKSSSWHVSSHAFDFWHLVDYKPKKKFLKEFKQWINFKTIITHTHTHTHTHINEIVASFRTKPKKRRKTKCLETIVNPIQKIIVVKALYYLG